MTMVLMWIFSFPFWLRFSGGFHDTYVLEANPLWNAVFGLYISEIIQHSTILCLLLLPNIVLVRFICCFFLIAAVYSFYEYITTYFIDDGNLDGFQCEVITNKTATFSSMCCVVYVNVFLWYMYAWEWNVLVISYIKF